MIQLALSLLLAAQLLLANVVANPNASPVLIQQAQQTASFAIQVAEQVLGGSTTPVLSPQEALGQAFTPMLASMPISAPIVAPTPISVGFNVLPIVTYISTSTDFNSGFGYIDNYSIHFETNVPATAVFTIYGSNEQDVTQPSTSFDIPITNLWHMQVPFKIEITDGTTTAVALGQLKG